ncbi:MAG: TatD family hydrolase [Victivallaceae bacterium]|nr:TatD family hydrolase [Victivallaceae bacterium]
MRYVDFHTHGEVPEGVVAIISGTVRPARGFFSRQCLPSEFTGEVPDLAGADALGEIGLDRRLAVPMDRQRAILRILLAAAGDLPVVIHCVRAYPELNAELKNFVGRVLLHRFNGSLREMDNQLASGRYLSFGFGDLRLAARVWRLRPELLALESDGKPTDYAECYRCAAEEFGTDQESLAACLENNMKVFMNVENL